MKLTYEWMIDKDIIKDSYENVHLSINASKEKIEDMKIFRKENYGDEFIYGNPAIHSETKDGIHLDNENQEEK